MTAMVYFIDGEPGELSSIEPSTKQATKCMLHYLNEGGANFVFRITATDESILPEQLQGKLLRLRKDLSHCQGTSEQLISFNKIFRPLFRTENVIQQELIGLDTSISIVLNSAVKDLVRESHRLHDFLPAEERFGLLVTDMTPSVGDAFLQLKPKWLCQSPTAPPQARRCRTCALRAQRASQQIRTATDAQESCPLDLVNEDVARRRRAARGMTADQLLQQYLVDQSQTPLRRLRDCQREFDPMGVWKASDSIDMISNFCKAMTLRDCTLFVRRTEDSIEARLGDLDLKQPKKMIRWKQVEQGLIAGGWYTNTEAKQVWKREEVCYFSRDGWSG